MYLCIQPSIYPFVYSFFIAFIYPFHLPLVCASFYPFALAARMIMHHSQSGEIVN